MLEIAWGVSLHTGRVVSAESRCPAICPRCRQPLTHAGLLYTHPAGSCTLDAIERALAWRVAMAHLSGTASPALQEHCVCCGDPTGDRVVIDGGRPAGCGALWIHAGLIIRLGGPTLARADEIRVRPREVLAAAGACWDAVARRKCAPCAGVQSRLDAADGAYLHAVALRRAAAERARGKGRALDRAAARWGLTAAWGPYQLEPRDCAACGASVVVYRWAGAVPPAPRPRVVCADGAQRCAACDEPLS